MRAEQLLSLYKVDPDAFRTLVKDYKNQNEPALRAHDRLAVWLKPQDVKYHSCEDLIREEGKSLARVTDNPPFFGFQLRTTGTGAIGSWDIKNQNYYMQAQPAAIGTLTYIAFETRRLFDAMKGEEREVRAARSNIARQAPGFAGCGRHGTARALHRASL